MTLPSKFSFCASNLTPEGLGTLEQYDHRPSGFLTLAGQNGAGKTGSAKIMFEKWGVNIYKYGSEIKTCLDKEAGIFLNIPSYYEKWKNFSIDKINSYEKVLEFERTFILVLDDLGLRSPSDSFLEHLYVIIDKRWNLKETATIITTNKSSKELAEMCGDAIMSRISSGKVVKFEGKDLRKNW